MVIADAVLKESSLPRGTEDSLIDIRKAMQTSFCDGKMCSHRDAKALHDVVSTSNKKLTFKSLVARIDFKDFDYFEGKSKEPIQLIEDSYAGLNTMNSASQAEFNDLSMDLLCIAYQNFKTPKDHIRESAVRFLISQISFAWNRQILRI